MFGDAYSTGAFSGVQLVVLGVLGFSLAVTLALYLAGLPIAMTGGAFVVIVVGSMLLSWPLLRRAAPRFETLENE